MVENESNNRVFFQKNYAWANNWGKPVAFGGNELLLLDKESDGQTWTLRPIHYSDIIRIRASVYRSLYLIVLGVLAAIVAVIVLILVLQGAATRLGFYIIPFTFGAFSYWAITGSKCVRLTFETMNGRLMYKSYPGSYNETLAAGRQLRDWANRIKIPYTDELPTGPA